MKKEKFLYGLSIVLLIVFIVFVIIDYSKYNDSYSAPFSAYILVRALEFVLPSIILFVVAKLISKKKK